MVCEIMYRCGGAAVIGRVQTPVAAASKVKAERPETCLLDLLVLVTRDPYEVA